MLIAMRKYLYPDQSDGSEVVSPQPGGTGVPECVLASIEKLFALESTQSTDSEPKALPELTPDEIASRLDAFTGRQQSRMEEMLQLVNLLASLTDSVSRAGSESRRRLEEVERDLRAACTDSSVSSIRYRLEKCLESVRQESASREREKREHLGLLDLGSASLRAMGSGKRRSGSRDDAIRQIDGSLPSGAASCIVFSFDQLDSISERFGVRAAEAVVDSYMRDVRTALAPKEEIPQSAWNPHVMLLIVPAALNPSAFRTAIEGVSLQRTVPVGGRFATIHLSLRWACFDRNAGGSSALISEKIEEFLNR